MKGVFRRCPASLGFPARMIRLVVLILALPLLPSCSGGAREAMPLRIAIALQPGSALMILAKEAALFEAEGLAPEYSLHPSGKRVLAEAIIAGKADIGSSSDLPVAEALGSGEEIAVLASLQISRSTNSIAARTDSGISTLGDLRGRRIGTQPLSALHYFLHKASEISGLEPESFQVVFFPIEGLVPALGAGEVDAVTVREPYLEEARAMLGAKLAVFELPWIYAQSDLVVAAAGYPSAHAEESKAVLRALLAAERMLDTSPKESSGLIAAALDIDIEPVREYLRGSLSQVSLTQAIIPQLESELDWLTTRPEYQAGQARSAPDIMGSIRPEYLRSVDRNRVDILETGGRP